MSLSTSSSDTSQHMHHLSRWFSTRKKAIINPAMRIPRNSLDVFDIHNRYRYWWYVDEIRFHRALLRLYCRDHHLREEEEEENKIIKGFFCSRSTNDGNKRQIHRTNIRLLNNMNISTSWMWFISEQLFFRWTNERTNDRLDVIAWQKRFVSCLI